MAKPDQIPTDLTIDLGDALSPDEFVEAVRNFMGFVDEITNAQSGDGANITWTVRVREGSTLIGVEPNADALGSRLEMIYRKAENALEAVVRGDIADAGLTEKGMKTLRNLSDLAAKKGNGEGVNIWVKRRSVPIGPVIAKMICEDCNPDYFDYGTIEGRLNLIKDVSGNLKIQVRDDLYPRAIGCAVPTEHIEQVLQGFRRRVEIEGKIRYRRDGTPISIDANLIEILPEDDDLPTAAEVRGIMSV